MRSMPAEANPTHLVRVRAQPRQGLHLVMLLVVDNRDSFTFNLVQAYQALGVEVAVRRGAALTVAEVERLAPERILIGPGPGRPEAAGASVELVRAFAGRTPLLGVCLGAQAIAVAFGATIGPSRAPTHGRVVRVDHDGHGVFRGLPNPLLCTRYNSLAIRGEDLPDELEVSGRSEEGEIQALRHREHCAEGVVFHPESIRSEHGTELLARFLAPEPAST